MGTPGEGRVERALRRGWGTESLRNRAGRLNGPARGPPQPRAEASFLNLGSEESVARPALRPPMRIVAAVHRRQDGDHDGRGDRRRPSLRAGVPVLRRGGGRGGGTAGRGRSGAAPDAAGDLRAAAPDRRPALGAVALGRRPLRALALVEEGRGTPRARLVARADRRSVEPRVLFTASAGVQATCPRGSTLYVVRAVDRADGRGVRERDAASSNAVRTSLASSSRATASASSSWRATRTSSGSSTRAARAALRRTCLNPRQRWFQVLEEWGRSRSSHAARRRRRQAGRGNEPVGVPAPTGRDRTSPTRRGGRDGREPRSPGGPRPSRGARRGGGGDRRGEAQARPLARPARRQRGAARDEAARRRPGRALGRRPLRLPPAPRRRREAAARGRRLPH